MPLPDRDHVRKTLAPFHADLRAIVLDSWSAWKAYPGNMIYRFGRTRACIVFEHIVRLADERLIRHPNVRQIPRHETQGWLIDDCVYLQFKKGDERGLSRNIPTSQALAFHDHEEQLPGIPEAQRIEIVYVLNPLETDVEEILVVSRDKKQITWSYPIADQATTITVVELTTRTPSPLKKPLVKLRETDQESKPNEQESKRDAKLRSVASAKTVPRAKSD